LAAITALAVGRWTGELPSRRETGVPQESDYDYYRRRANEEMEAAEGAHSDEARASHVQLATQYSILAKMIRTELRRPKANDNS
jgi:hypothetical protein